MQVRQIHAQVEETKSVFVATLTASNDHQAYRQFLVGKGSQQGLYWKTPVANAVFAESFRCIYVGPAVQNHTSVHLPALETLLVSPNSVARTCMNVCASQTVRLLCRAVTANDVAQQAASSKSEKVLRVAVERAERATHEAKAAERRAAEAAAHSIAHQEVSTSQAEVADQARLSMVPLARRLTSHVARVSREARNMCFCLL